MPLSMPIVVLAGSSVPVQVYVKVYMHYRSSHVHVVSYHSPRFLETVSTQLNPCRRMAKFVCSTL
jgi:hypothetical protein